MSPPGRPKGEYRSAKHEGTPVKAWWADTLGKRLFILMWVALVISHFTAFSVVRGVLMPERAQDAPASGGGLPIMPSLPPAQGFGDAPRQPPPPRSLPPGDPAPYAAVRPANAGRPGLSTRDLMIDYGIRLLVIALAAWWGSRWLATPMGRLVNASRALSGGVARGQTLPRLDEQHGTREVREAAQVFNTMAQQLREQFEARSLMVAAISHDLRTPLTRLRMRLEDPTLDPQVRERSIADVHEMNELIDSVLEVFRGDHPDGAQRLRPTDVGALVQSLVDDLQELGGAVSFAGDSAVALADPAALKRVVGNLLSNALRYGERAQAWVTQDEAHVYIGVDDHGPGIAATELDAVFRPFYRVEASRNRHSGGAGLGLYIARELTLRQGGQLSLGNRSEGGLRATIVLPRR